MCVCVCVCNVFVVVVVVVAIAIRQTSEHNKTTFRQDSTNKRLDKIILSDLIRASCHINVV